MRNNNSIKGDNNASVAGNSNAINRYNPKGVQKRSYGSYWVSGSSLFISIVCFALIIFSYETLFDHISIVLGFIGVLATFIVIGNYLQVRRVEDKIEELQDNLNVAVTDTERLKEKVKGMQMEIAELRGRLFNINPKGIL